ncbi:MAG: hypothetical protein Q7S68_05470 [Deltaproteobacteria bacterium]|nr:hypothetical protein [Deltaproteobacteria bacterium]
MSDLCLKIGAGANALISTPLSEGGGGYYFFGNICNAPDPKNRYWVGARYDSDQQNGTNLVNASDHQRIMASFHHEQVDDGKIESQNIFVGLGDVTDKKTIELGSYSPIFSRLWAMNSDYGWQLDAYAGLFSGIALPSDEAETIPLFAIKAGIQASFVFLPETSEAEDEEEEIQRTLTRFDLPFYWTSGTQRLVGNFFASRFTDAVITVQECQMCQELGDAFTKPKGTVELESIGLFSQGLELARDFRYYFRADDDQRDSLLSRDGALFLSYLFGGLLLEKGANLLTQATAQGLQFIAAASRKADPFTTADAKSLLINRLIINSIPIVVGGLIGAEASTDKASLALFQGGMLASIGTTWDPDPANSELLDTTGIEGIFQIDLTNEKQYFGLQKMDRHLDELYTFTRALKAIEGEEIVLTAGAGTIVGSMGNFSFDLGLHHSLFFKESAVPIPGIGGDASLHFISDSGFEAGATESFNALTQKKSKELKLEAQFTTSFYAGYRF